MVGLTTINGFPLSMDERLAKLKEAGFGSVLMWWGNDETESREERIKLAAKHNLQVENVHAQTDDLNAIWADGENGERIISELLNEIADCRQYGISTIVMHLTNGSNPPPISKTGVSRVERLIGAANKMNVRVAFENMRVPEHTKYFIDNYRTPFVGLCYDSGHENYWTPETDWLSLYSDRIFAIHLHDNCGDADSHMIPFDGDINWSKKLRQLSRSNYKGSIALECEYHHGIYETGGFENYLKKAYRAGASIEHLITG
ncbi:MAG: sugar phosphate isomerase/epimerase family protein [Clostridiaceae bacterium]|nr:sugar phosphate isomerase/epimerase family protein [Clostridiaceae bacterium]